MACFMFFKVPSRVLPEATQPGKSGEQAEKFCSPFSTTTGKVRGSPMLQSSLLQYTAPGIMTRPGFDRCLYYRWLPRCTTKNHPSASIFRIASETFTGISRQLSTVPCHSSGAMEIGRNTPGMRGKCSSPAGARRIGRFRRGCPEITPEEGRESGLARGFPP